MFFDPELIQEKPGWNGRDMESDETIAHIRRMADCIKENGVDAFPPITIYQADGQIFVSAGHCRRRAHILAKQEGAPIKGICCRADTLSEEDRVLDLLNGNAGLDLTSLEKAEVVKRLVSFGWIIAEVARRTAQSSTTIENQLILANAPMEVKNMVKNGEVSARTATDVLRTEGVKALEVLKRAVQTAQDAGKKKATGQHLPKAKGIKWGTWGPKLQTALEKITTPHTGCGISLRAHEAAISEAKNLLAEMAEQC